ncbi:DUF885 family protein [Shewanella sp. JM162201]|uniref:DUF885 family protein n=1 Tax=Shewanella jiangmenensis TaxID=2837387 RepID=A0ABS5V8I7_9GAMM|nr:DUF885 domain-containing protein [Shewanella jiangmenensis]MBT1446162.1 DUF885 family protein [Shewanella jiangmenensis]
MHKLFKPTLLVIAVGGILSGCNVTTTASDAYKYSYDASRPAQTAEPQSQAAETTAKVAPLDKNLQSIIDKAWALEVEISPGLAASKGDKAAARKLPDLSPERLAQTQLKRQELLASLTALDRSKLSKEDRINADILQGQIQNEVDMYEFKDHYMPISSEGGFHAYIASMAKGSFKTREDYDNYLAKLDALPQYFAQQTFWLRQGLASGITPPKVTLNGFEDSISAFMVPVEQSSYFEPFKQFPASFSAADKAELTKAGRKAVADKVLPQYQAFYDFMTTEYMPNARETIAAYDMPNGNAFYENRVRYYTTLDMTSDEVHQLGLKEVARIRAEMEEVIKSTGFKGSFDEFLHFLRTDPRFYATTPEQLLKEAAYIAKKADAMLPKFFGKLPRQPYGIEPVPAEIAPKYTTGRYSGSSSPDKAGYYWVNTYALDKRPLYEMEALTLHEAVPGHHLQIALNQELDKLPDFRRYSYISAFGEGWGLYSEYLGLEGGFYTDPYSNFGRLTYEMWRAARLVVDTGMHAKGWSRQQAIDFMAGNTALSLHNVNTEIDRYISWPGQAVSYKIGELTIKRLRAKAEAALGDKFDIRAFHDAVLAHGSVPLSVLEQQIDDFIATAKAG